MEKIKIKELFKDCFKNLDGSLDNTIRPKVLEIIRDHKLLKCFLPKEYGGKSLALLETLEVIEQCSYVNGSLGWLIQIGNGGSYFVTNLEQPVAQELFSPRNAVLTGSGTPTGEAIESEGGYLFTGFSKFCSGSDYATLFTATAFIQGTTEIITGIVPRNEVKISNSWNPIGMKATSSHTSNFHEVFVPNERIFRTAKRISHLDLPILNLPFILFAQAFFIHVVYGLTARFLDESEVILKEKRTLWHEHVPKRVLEVENFIVKTRALIENSKDQSSFHFLQLESGKIQSEDLHEAIKNEIIESAINLKNQVHTHFHLFGMDVLDQNHPMNVVYCDLITITQHQLLNKN